MLLPSGIPFSLACRSTAHPRVICEESSATTKLSSALSLRLFSCKYPYVTDALYLVSGFNIISSIFFHPSVRRSSLHILFILRSGHLWLQRPLTFKITVFSICLATLVYPNLFNATDQAVYEVGYYLKEKQQQQKKKWSLRKDIFFLAGKDEYY